MKQRRKQHGWLAMQPVEVTLAGYKHIIRLPDNCIGLLAVYRYKKDARAVSGPKVILLEVELEWPKAVTT